MISSFGHESNWRPNNTTCFCDNLRSEKFTSRTSVTLKQISELSTLHINWTCQTKNRYEKQENIFGKLSLTWRFNQVIRLRSPPGEDIFSHSLVSSNVTNNNQSLESNQISLSTFHLISSNFSLAFLQHFFFRILRFVSQVFGDDLVVGEKPWGEKNLYSLNGEKQSKEIYSWILPLHALIGKNPYYSHKAT